MLVKMRTNYAGPYGTASAGGLIDLPEKVAVDLVSKGHAEYAEPEPKPKHFKKTTTERAVVIPPENEVAIEGKPDKVKKGKRDKTKKNK